MATITLTPGTYKVYTLLPQSDSVIKEQEYIADPLVDNVIGERKMFEVTYTAGSAMVDRRIYFNPALFQTSAAFYSSPGSPPANSWQYITGSAVPVGETDMLLYVQAGQTPEKTTNFRCTIEFSSDTEFTIRLYYYQVYDLINWLNPSVENNHAKLLKDRNANPLELDLSGTSVYTSDKSCINFYLFVQDLILPADKGWDTRIIPYQAGFYAKEEQAGAPYFTGEEFILERAAGIVTSLSAVEDTKIRFRVTQNCTFMMLWLIRVDTVDNSVTFLQNYDYSFERITTVPGSTTIHNKFKGPSVAPASVTGKYECSVHVDSTLLTYGQKYRIIGIAYSEGETWEVNAFISDEEYVVDELPSYTGDEMEVTGSLSDYDREYFGNDLVCVVEERMRSKMLLQFPGDQYKDEIFDRLGLAISNDIRRYLVKIECTIYTDVTILGNTTRQIYARAISNKISPTSYTSASGLTLDFSTSDEATFKFDWRNRYEDNLLNIETQVNGVPLITPTSNQDWAGRVLTVEWKFTYNYDDYFVPFTDTVFFKQIIRPKDYEFVNLKIENQETEDENDDFTCIQDETLCLQARLNSGGDENEYSLITTIEKSPGSIATIEENEEWVGDVLPQLDSDKFVNQEADFEETTANLAKFCIDLSKVNTNVTYKISAIAKRDESNCAILLETGDPILLETGGELLKEIC